MRLSFCLALLMILSARACLAAPPADSGKGPGGDYARWSFGPGRKAPGNSGQDFFPVAVWLQDPRNAAKYKAIGINLYVGLWKGPTEAQLAALARAQMPVICDQNAVGLKHRNDPVIVAWMHGDEPDNAQPRPGGKGYGPPVAPGKIVADYKRIKAADPTRPVMLNLGQGVAWDGWVGRGVRTNHPEDYPKYVQGCDVASFDIYPAVSTRKPVAGNLWYVAHGVTRLTQWARPRVVWNCIECTRISNTNTKPTPGQVRAEVWMSLIHGSKGLIYFAHQFKPRFIEAGLLADAEMARAVGRINARIHQLAPVLNSPTLPDAVKATSSDEKVPLAVMAKRHGGATYVFAVAMRDGKTTGTFEVRGLAPKATVEVLDESRTIPAPAGRFTDTFDGYGVHLYRVK